MPIKINYTMYSMGLTGGVRVIFEIANRLADRGHEVTITALGDKEDHGWIELEPQVIYAKGRGLTRVKRRILQSIGKLLDSPSLSLASNVRSLYDSMDECDINVATYCFTTFPVYMSGKGHPFYHMQHYEPLFFSDQYRKKMAEISYYLPLSKITNSTWLREKMNEMYGENPPVVNPAIDHEVFYPRGIDREDGALRVLAFGKDRRWKGFPEALEAMEIVKGKREDVEFIAFGMSKPTYPTKIDYTFVKAPSDEELAELYSSADVMICPSWYESFPLFPLEGMACGAPVITTPYGTEDYSDHGENCLVVPPRDSESLASAILRLLDNEDLRERFRKKGPETAKRFTWERTVDSVEEIFERELER